MRAIVDDTCIGCGLCADMCPEVFEMEGSMAVVIVADVPEEAEISCSEAAENCPVDAISVE